MEIILHKEVSGLGRTGDVVKVADGYARNFLIPRGLAEKATAASLKSWEGRREKLAKQAEKKKAASGDLAAKVGGQELKLKEKAGEEGQLFGSVNAARIAAALKEAKLEVEESAVMLESPIKKLGEYEVEIKLGEAPFPKVKVVVEGEGEEKK